MSKNSTDLVIKCMYGMTPIPMHDVISTTENCAVLRGRMCDRHNETVYCLNSFLRGNDFIIWNDNQHFVLIMKYLRTVLI